MRSSFCIFSLILIVAASLPAADSRAIADAAFDELLNGDFAALAKRFSPEMSAAMPSEKLPAAIGPVLKSLGTLRSGRPEPQATSRQGFDVFPYPAEFEKAKLTVVISINSAGQVGGLFLRPPQPETAKPGEPAVTTGNNRIPATRDVAETGQALASLKAGAVVSEVFRTTPDGDLSLWIHLPDDWSIDDKRPAIIFFFGGGWTNGAVQQFEPQAAYLVSRGMVAVRADYRVFGREKVNPDSCVLDAMAAMRWVRAHASALGIDPDRIVSSGGSSGGQLAACVGIGTGLKGDGDYLEVPYKSNAMVLFNPALDMPAIQERRKENSGRTQMNWQLDDETALKISPKHNVSENAPPTILFFGTEDILLGQLEPFLEEMKSKGNKAEVYIAQGQQHGFFNRPPWLERTIKRMDEFLAGLGYLEGPPTIQVPEGEAESSAPEGK